MTRSASTWLYNVIRLLYGGEYECGWISGPSDELTLTQSPKWIVKIHNYSESLAQKSNLVFTSHRDLRDVCASFQRMFGHYPSINDLSFAMEQYRKWKLICCLDMKYETMIENRVLQIGRISEIIGISANLEDINNKVNSLRKGNPGEHDQTNLLHDNHITNGGIGTYKDVPDRIIKEIERTFGAWLRKEGYT